MSKQLSLPEEAVAINPVLDAARHDHTHEIARDLAYRRLGIVNVMFVGSPGCGDRNWVLVDAGVPGTRGLIEEAAAERFGLGARPSAIVMTHGHFDHIGALEELARKWDAPVYAHALERPYLDGTAAYPPGDPSVGGGMMAAMARFYPRGPVDVSGQLATLPEDGSVPGMPGWRWIHTPGHSVGHVSLWREEDGALIAGDAFVTTEQESAYAVAVQDPVMHGPPMYYTVEWDKARQSVQRLAALRPKIVVTGHGRAMQGPEMQSALDRLAAEFDTIAVPAKGQYLSSPARAEDGTAYRKP
jgi:glyoxylase-like metal-dependent hydrolase (beta-lactamase superfamily II)